MKFAICVVVLSVVCALPSSRVDEDAGEYGPFYQGDILLPLPKMLPGNGYIDESYRWPGGRIPYRFSKKLLHKDKRYMDAVLRGMKDIMEQSKGCIQFVPEKFKDPDLIYIDSQGYPCNSYVGRLGGPQLVNYGGDECFNHGTIVHELLHAIGFFHEHCRPDRDDYVTINHENCYGTYDFEKQSSDEVTCFDEPYDYLSVMHYEQYAFSKNESIPTIYTKDPHYQTKIGQRIGMSELDVTKLMKMYNCTM